MRTSITLLFIFINFLGVISPQFVFTNTVVSASDVSISGTVPGCGDGVIQSGEQCDGSNLAGQICVGLGFFGGSLSCNLNCTFNTSACTTAPPPAGGGGWFFIPPPAPVTGVTLSGRAYPGMKVTVLKDAQIVAITVADANANFSVSVTGISSGNYIFSVYSEDSKGIRSSLLTFPISVTSGVTINIGGIFIAPTIAVDKNEVRRGDNIAIFGQSVPSGEITISVSSPKEFFVKTLSDKDGVYLYNFDTSPLDMGQHSARSKAALDGAISSFSKAISFAVGTKNIAKDKPAVCGKADLNCDGRVNLIDFSILAYWYKRPSPLANIDLNGDGKINLVDFSIMAFHWTG